MFCRFVPKKISNGLSKCVIMISTQKAWPIIAQYSGHLCLIEEIDKKLLAFPFRIKSFDIYVSITLLHSSSETGLVLTKIRRTMKIRMRRKAAMTKLPRVRKISVYRFSSKLQNRFMNLAVDLSLYFSSRAICSVLPSYLLIIKGIITSWKICFFHCIRLPFD